MGGRRFVVKPYEILNVTARFLDVPRRIIRIEGAVPDNDRPGVECFDFVNGGEPIVKPFSIGLHEIGMRAVVNGIARDDEIDRWHVKTCSVIGICMADIHGDDRTAFEAEAPIIERARQRQDDLVSVLEIVASSSQRSRVRVLFAYSPLPAAMQPRGPKESDREEALTRRNGRDAHG